MAPRLKLATDLIPRAVERAEDNPWMVARALACYCRPRLKDAAPAAWLGLYSDGITSERRLAEDLPLHLAFMWFVGYDLDERTPDHSVLSKARRRFGVRI